MVTINGKLINQQRQQLEDLHNKISLISADTDKLKSFLNYQTQYLQSKLLILNYLQEKIDHLEGKNLGEINKKLNTIEQKMSQKLLTLVMLTLVLVGRLSGLLLFNKQNNSCSVIASEKLI
jgi:transcriptional antiterminator